MLLSWYQQLVHSTASPLQVTISKGGQQVQSWLLIGRLWGRCSQVCHSGASHKDERKWVSVRGDIRKNIICMRTVQEWSRGPERLCHLHPTWAGQSPGQPGGGQAAPVLSRRLDQRPPKVPFSLNYPVNLWAHLDLVCCSTVFTFNEP